MRAAFFSRWVSCVVTPVVTFGERWKQERNELLAVSLALIIVTSPSRASRFLSGGPGGEEVRGSGAAAPPPTTTTLP